MINKITNTLSAIVTIVLAIPTLYTGFNAAIVWTYIIIIFMIYIIPLLVKYKGKLYNIALYYMGNQEYNVEIRDTYYEFITRTSMKHIKSFIIIPKIKQLNQYSTRYGWSKDGEYDVQPLFENQNIVKKWKNDKMTHITILFDRYYSKNERLKTGLLLNDLEDKNKESQLYLSTGIFDRTKLVKLTVKFEKNLYPCNIKLYYYKYYFDLSPAFVKELKYNFEESKIEYTESFPVLNSKYMITWDFENDNR